MFDSAIDRIRPRSEAWHQRYGLVVLAVLALAASGLFLVGAVLTV